MLVCGEESIREVMAFPKNNRGQDLMSQSPSEVDPRQLRDLESSWPRKKRRTGLTDSIRSRVSEELQRQMHRCGR